MIEISHAQAQLLIRQAIDRRLVDDQWAVLQVHLEGCAECRDYQQRLKRMEHDVRRAVRLRWNPVNQSTGKLGDRVVAVRRRRARVREIAIRTAKYGGGILAVILFFYLYSTYQRLTAPPPRPTPWPTELGAERTATARALAFHGAVAFSSAHEGNAEIYLLTPGGGEENQLFNLTSASDSNETAPAWSPDGEWIAFLSDRDSPPGFHGKRDLYVMHVAGSRLTRLTNDPQVDFRGPLSWSYDGQGIAALGDFKGGKGQASTPFLHLVPVFQDQEGERDGELDLLNEPERKGGYTLPGTRGVDAAEFSRDSAFLAYTAGGAIDVYFPESGDVLSGNPADRQGYFVPGPIDWSSSGLWLGYTSQGPYDPITGQLGPNPRSLLRVTLQYNSTTRQAQTTSRTDLIVRSEDKAEAYRSVSWSPDATRRWLAYLQESADLPGCWTVRLETAPSQQNDSSGIAPREFKELCVEGDPYTALDGTSWTSDGDWLVLAARRVQDGSVTDTASLYALRLPPDPLSNAPAQVERITDLAFAVEPDSLPAPRPRPVLGWGEQVLSIQPEAIGTPEPTVPAPRPSAPGGLLFTAPGAGEGTVSELRLGVPARSGNLSSRRLLSVPAGIDCPSISPDGTQYAFLSGDSSTGINQVFVVGSEGAPARPVIDDAGGPPISGARSGCPVWSPDGELLATVIQAEEQSYLALLPMQRDSTRLPEGPVYVPVERPSEITLPLWTPDGKQVYLLSTHSGNRPARLLAYNVEAVVSEAEEGIAPMEEDSTYTVALFLSGWDDIHGWAFAPEGDRFALLLSRVNRDGTPLTQLRVLDRSSFATLLNVELDEYAPAAITRTNPLAWTPDGQIAFLYFTGLQSKIKAGLMRFDPMSHQNAILAEFPHLAFDAAFSPDFAWAAVVTESGLWLVDMVNEPRPSPLLLDGSVVGAVDWR